MKLMADETLKLQKPSMFTGSKEAGNQKTLVVSSGALAGHAEVGAAGSNMRQTLKDLGLEDGAQVDLTDTVFPMGASITLELKYSE